jgi:hypothetical protein
VALLLLARFSCTHCPLSLLPSQQLNFYAFRKIKYADTIRIDPKLEAETANYWRFRHEKFQRGKPELLGEIKRMNGQKQQQKKETTPNSSNSSSSPPSQCAEKENTALKSEVSSLKQRIDAMYKNIDELTSMVQKVTLVSQQQHQQPRQDLVNVNNKRTKTMESTKVAPMPDAAMSAPPAVEAPLPSMELDDFPLPPSIPSPMPVVDRVSTSSSELSDEGFVDQLFTAFKTEDFDFDEAESTPHNSSSSSDKESNRPRPALMNRLSGALSVLPRDIQELIVNRLIQAITSPKEIQEHISAAHALETSVIPKSQGTQEQQQNLQLAAATLAALLSQCGGDTKVKEPKTLLIPVHA